MDRPTDRFTPRSDDQLPLRLPAALQALPEPEPEPEHELLPVETAGLVMPADETDLVNLAVEFTRVVPASGNLAVGGQQFWLGTHRAGIALTLRADTSVVELLAAGVRIKKVPSRLTASHLRQLLATGGTRVQPAAKPTRPGPGEAIEVDRTINACGLLSLAGRQHPIGYQFAGRRLTIRIAHRMCDRWRCWETRTVRRRASVGCPAPLVS